MTVRALVRDAAVQAAIDDRGWAVVDLLDADAVGRANEAYRSLVHEVTVDRSFAPGFHATIMDGRPDFRRASHDAIAAAVAGPFERLFDRATLTLTNWLHKQPGAAAVPFHVDWTFVDEPEHRSMSVWSPLRDTDDRTGCLGVVDRSHRRVDFIRAAAHPTYEQTDAYGAHLRGRHLLPLRAGQAVVFDHRLVHYSAPHAGPGERVAISCEVVPAEATIRHYEYLGDGRFRRHRVTADFFATYEAGSDPRQSPGHLDDEDVDGPWFGSRPEHLTPRRRRWFNRG